MTPAAQISTEWEYLRGADQRRETEMVRVALRTESERIAGGETGWVVGLG